jgi:two-component system, OmpR family, sensor histidine kinase KdpD
MPESNPPLLVALGSDAQALRLIHQGFWRAREEGRPWVAVHVEVPEEDAESADQARLWVEEAASLGAQCLWIQARTRMGGLLEAIRTTGSDLVILGQGRDHWPWTRLGHSSAQELLRRQPPAQVEIVPLGPDLPPDPLLPPPGQRLGALVGGLGVLGACLGLSRILPPGQPLPAIHLIFLTGTAYVAQTWGRLAGAVAVGLAGWAFHTLPPGQPGMGEWPLTALFLVVLGGGQVAVALAQRLERQTRTSRRRAALLAVLLLLGRNLAKAMSPQEVGSALAHLGERLLRRPVELLVPAADGTWDLHFSNDDPPTDFLGALARRHLDPRFMGGFAYLPVGNGEALEGLLRVRAGRMGDLDEDAWELLRAIAVQVALALERISWLERAQRSRLEHETERLRSTLLGAISHDFRTPLAAIQGASSSLMLASEPLAESTRRDLLAMIQSESERLGHLLADILDLTRLECGEIRVQKEWHPLEEVVGAALRRVEEGLEEPWIRVVLPEDLPLVSVDGVLLEQLLLNLLGNARRHAPGSPVDLRAWLEGRSLELEVADRGPGIPLQHREAVFGKFFRLPDRVAGEGVGLGLAICDAIARAHGGRIWVEERAEGGASFRVSLPWEEAAPELPAEEEMT